MKISMDQSITNTGCVAFTTGGLVIATTIVPDRKLTGHLKQKNTSDQVIRWLDDLQRTYPEDPIEEICLEEFIKYVPQERIEAMMRVQRFTGYLWARLENWITINSPNCRIRGLNKGNISKNMAQMISKSLGFVGDEHQCDAFHQGVLCGYVET